MEFVFAPSDWYDKLLNQSAVKIDIVNSCSHRNYWIWQNHQEKKLNTWFNLKDLDLNLDKIYRLLMQAHGPSYFTMLVLVKASWSYLSLSSIIVYIWLVQAYLFYRWYDTTLFLKILVVSLVFSLYCIPHHLYLKC